MRNKKTRNDREEQKSKAWENWVEPKMVAIIFEDSNIYFLIIVTQKTCVTNSTIWQKQFPGGVL